MGVTTIKPDNLVIDIEETVGITLASGVSYTAGMVVVNQDTGLFKNADVVLSGAIAATPQVSYDAQVVYVLAADYDATAGNVEAVGYSGSFNENVVTLPGTQTKAAIAGVLQAKGINLKLGAK